MLIRDGIFSDETAEYKTPYEPNPGDTVTLRLRTPKGSATRVEILIGGSILKPMIGVSTRGYFDYYEYSFKCKDEPFSYCFVISDDEESIYYNRMGCMESDSAIYRFSFVPGFHVPGWAKGTTYYQIMTDRFCNGDEHNDVVTDEYEYHGHVKHIDQWDALPETTDIHNFHGGDLQGVMQKLDYLQSIGVETIYFNPLFVSPSNHKYDTQDYEHIDPHLAVIKKDEGKLLSGSDTNNSHAKRYIARVTSSENLDASNAYFAQLVQEMHRRGMRVVMDGVFNHCGSFNRWLDREGIYKSGRRGAVPGAYQALESPYRSYFRFDKADEAHSEYEGWWNYHTLPKLNYEQSPELWEHILKIGEQWVSAPYHVDGWRLDVAADLAHSEDVNHRFWQDFRSRVRSANGEAVIIAEHYTSVKPWLNGKEWDSVMNYSAFMEPVTWFLTGMEKHSDSYDNDRYNNGISFFHTMLEEMSKFPRPSLDAAMNELSNHDHSRFLTRTNRTVGRLASKGSNAAGQNVDKNVMKLGVLIQMTWPGSPAIYYGDEAGVVGWTDPDCRRVYPWGKEDQELIAFHQKAAQLRRDVNCLRMGSVMKLSAGDGYIAYGRMNAQDCAVVMVNNNDHAMTITVPVWLLDVPDGAILTKAFTSATTAMEQAFPGIAVVSGRRLSISLPPKSGCVYTYPAKG